MRADTLLTKDNPDNAMAGARRLILEVAYGTPVPTVTALSFLYSLGERKGMHPNARCTSMPHFFFFSGLLSALGRVSSFVPSLQVTLFLISYASEYSWPKTKRSWGQWEASSQRASAMSSWLLKGPVDYGTHQLWLINPFIFVMTEWRHDNLA